MAHRILRRSEVEQMTGLSRSTIYLKIKNGSFPAPVRLSERAVGWPEPDIRGWQEGLPRTRYAKK